MKLNENINRIKGIMGLMVESFPDNIKSILKNKALVVNFPYAGDSVISEERPWFSVIIYPKSIGGKIERILSSFLDKSNLYYNITTKDDIDYGVDNPNYGRLFDILVKTAHNVSGKKMDDNNNAMVIYFSPKTSKEANNNRKLYHVTYSPMVGVEGLKTKSTIKYNNRIYLWDDLDIAINYGQISHHRNKDIFWVYEVDASGMDLFKDQEEQSRSFYVENDISPNNLKLVYTYK